MTTTLVPIGIFYGSGQDGTILQHAGSVGNAEGESFFTVRVATDYIAPSVLTAIFATLTWDQPMTVKVVPVLDDTTYDEDGPFDLSTSFALPAVTKKTTRTFLVPIYELLFDPVDGVTPIGRVALRGTWAGAILETVGEFEGFFQVDELAVEFEPANESETEVTPV